VLERLCGPAGSHHWERRRFLFRARFSSSPFLFGVQTCWGLLGSILPYNTTLILVSLDGFRPEYLERGITPNITAFGKTSCQGGRKCWLKIRHRHNGCARQVYETQLPEQDVSKPLQVF